MKYIMSKETLQKQALLQGAVEGRYTVKEVAQRLKVGKRRVKQMKKAFKERGPESCIHGNSRRHPANYTDDVIREQIVALKTSPNYRETNFTHYRELLAEREGIQISYSALCGILKSAGIESKRKHRTEGRRFRRRNRKRAIGEMLQVDASSYDWFGNGKRCALHGFIDDATGAITGLYFCQNECLMGYLEALRQTLTEYGVPAEIYADKAGIFFVNTKKQEHWTIEESLAGKTLDKTQFGLIAEERLGITMTSAHTPQAKGRIERLWGTLQDRLPVWLKLEGITSMDQANDELRRFVAVFNARFTVEPQAAESMFVPVDSSHNLDKLLAVCHERTTDNCGCFSFQNCIFQIEAQKPLAKKRIKFLFSQKIGFLALHDKEYYPISFLGVKKNGKMTHMPDVVTILIQKHYYTDGKGGHAA